MSGWRDGLERDNRELCDLLALRDAEIARLKEREAALTKEVERLRARVFELQDERGDGDPWPTRR